MKRAHQQIQRKMPGPVALRRPWLDLIDDARLMAGRTMGTVYAPASMQGVGAAFDGFEQLRHLRLKCRKDLFPVEGFAAVALADAFLKVVDAFALRELPAERRERFAPAVLGCADAVMGLLDEQRGAEAARSWHNQLERD
ncbi:MAG: hypothetical protein P4L73_19130 [Caulobacteraceae bacterium]|nr:hypothetical protein [Caulobacteraceae bacterium]